MATPPFVIKRPTQLPRKTDPVPSDVTVSDDGSSLSGVTWEDGVNAAIPVASQSEAADGTDNHKRMTPLTTRQAIDEQVPPKISMAIAGLNLGSAAQAQVQDFATAEQGTKADTAVQPDDLASVATSGSYNDLSDKPILGTAASTDASDYATAEQGDKADSAVQPDDLALVATSGSYGDLSNKPTLGTAAATDASDYATAVQAVPAGGEAGQVLQKNSLTDNDVKWGTIFSPPPANLQNSRMDAQLSDIPPDVEFVSTAGFSAPGDGGGALYKRVSSEPSHAGKFQSADGAWWEIVGPEVNAKAFGVTANGVTSDSDALNSAAAYVATVGGTLHLPPGTIRLTASLAVIGASKPFKIAGAGIDKTVLLRDSTAGAVAVPVSITESHGWEISDFTLDFNRRTHTGGSHGIRASDCNSIRIRRVKVINWTSTGIICLKVNASSLFNNIVEDCHLDGYNDAANGILVEHATYSGMRHCTVINLGKSSTPCYALQLKNQCSRCFIENSHASGAKVGIAFGQEGGVTAVQRSLVSGCTVTACDTGIAMGYARQNIIDGVSILHENQSGSAVTLLGCDENTIRGLSILYPLGPAEPIWLNDSHTNYIEVDYFRNSAGIAKFVEFAGNSSANKVKLLQVNTGVPTNNYDWVENTTTNQTNLFSIEGVPTSKTSVIASGVALLPRSVTRLYVDTEGNAATDDLTTLTASYDGHVVTISTVNNTRDVTVKHNAGNILLSGTADFALTGIADTLTLIYNANSARWCEVARGDNI